MVAICPAGSSPAIGSSAISSGVCCASVRAIRTRACSPPERAVAVRSRSSVNAIFSSATSTASRSCGRRRLPRGRCGIRPSATRVSTLTGHAISRFWGIHAQRRARSAAGLALNEQSPSWATSPRVARISVVLPAPFGPISPTHSPSLIDRLTPSTTGRRSRCTVMLSNVSRVIAFPRASCR